MSGRSVSATESALPQQETEKTPGADSRDGDRSVAAVHPPLTAADRRAIEHLVTEDDTPVDNRFSEKQRRLLTGPLDLGTVLLRTRYRDRPAHAFGLIALGLALGSAMLLATTLTRALHPAWASTAVAMAILLGVSAAVFLASGWLAELLLHRSVGKSEAPGPQIEEACD